MAFRIDYTWRRRVYPPAGSFAATGTSAGPLFTASFLSFDTGASPAAIVWR